MSGPGPWPRRLGLAPLILGLALCLLLSAAVAVALGPAAIPPARVWAIAGHQLFPDLFAADWSAVEESIVWRIRFPRVLLGALVGAGLAVVGATVQAFTRNRLADPYLFGISSGASTGAVVVLLYTGAVFGAHSLSIGAFLGALLSLLLVFSVTRRSRRVLSAERFVLAGVAVSFVLSALTSFLVYNAAQSRQAEALIFWLLGGLGNAQWAHLGVPAAALIGGAGVLVLQARRLNALMVGEETAVTLGVGVDRFRLQLFVLSALITGVMVAVSGAIGFVGLMMPHIVRLTVGGDNRRLLPICALMGAIFLVWVDVGARTLLAPRELPVGVITAGLGGLFFIWLMRGDDRRFAG